MDRGAGVLMHIASLPGDFGIGSFGEEAYKFADFMKKAGLKYWQILPLGHTGYGDSPYQCFSAYAGNPYFIDFYSLKEEGLLTEKDYINENYGIGVDAIDYGKIFISKYKVLRRAYENYKANGKEKIKEAFAKFKDDKAFWLEEYAFYMALKNKFDLQGWSKWDEDIKRRDKDVMAKYKEELKDDIEFWSFVQYLFYDQWSKLKKYVNDLGIKVIGDIPIYVAEDSVDTWSSPENFKIDKETLKPTVVAGCPPDAFAKTGQLWGNLIYDWDYMKKNNYDWWVQRIKESLQLYDVLRIDHFRGFESYWEIPYGDETAVNGKWVKGPGIDLFKTIKKELGDVDIIAEDLGFMTDDVKEFLKQTGFPGMRLLQFGFDGDPKNMYSPHNYVENSIAYTETHDNDTIMGWYENTSSKLERKRAKMYLGLNSKEGCNWGFIRGVLSCNSKVAVIPLQDFLNLGSESRMNVPSVLGGNWIWRARKENINDMLSTKIYKYVRMYGRCDINE